VRLNLLEHSGPVQACNGIASFYTSQDSQSVDNYASQPVNGVSGIIAGFLCKSYQKKKKNIAGKKFRISKFYIFSTPIQWSLNKLLNRAALLAFYKR